MSFTSRPSYEHAPASSSSIISAEEENLETVNGLMNQLAIERRVQYGAEKMLDVIEQRGGSAGDEQEQIIDRISAQLEASNAHIKSLEARLERVQAAGTPNKSRRRPQPRSNGAGSASSSSLNVNAPYSTSLSSSMLSGSARPHLNTHGSSLTPDRTGGSGSQHSSGRATPSYGNGGSGSPSYTYGSSPSRASMRRTESAGHESVMTGISDSMGLSAGAGQGGGRMSWGRSRSDLDARSEPRDAGQPDDENTGVLLETISVTLRRLRELSRRAASSRKGKEVERGDEPWDCLTRVADMLKKSSELRESINAPELVHSFLPYLCDSSTPRRRAAAYRALRYALTRITWGIMVNTGLEWLVIRCLTRDAKAVLEREHALRLLRSVMMLPLLPAGRRRRPSASRSHSRASPTSFSALSPRHAAHRDQEQQVEADDMAGLLEKRVPLTGGMIRALVAVAENPDDAMRTVCMETLLEIAILDLDRLVEVDAFRTILLALKDGPAELGPAITGMLLVLANSPETRKRMMPGSDLELVIAGLTEAYGIPPKGHSKYMDKLQATVKNIGMMMSSWPGLLYLCMDDCRAIKSLVNSLYVPAPEMRESLLDLMFSVLRIKLPSFADAFLQGKRLTAYNRTQQAASQMLQDGVEEDEPRPALSMVDHFVALILAILLESGLMIGLIALIQESGPVSRKATLLLGEILRLSNRILPLQYAAQLQTLPLFFNGATTFGDAKERNFALGALSSIDSLNRNQSRVRVSERPRDPVKRGQNSLNATKMKAYLAIEDKQFQQMIVDSGVLIHRDHIKWNYDTILELVEGPLLNPKRLDEAIRATKFIRRLFSFFHPYNNRFSSIKKTRPSQKWVRLGCSLMSTMLSCPEGVKFVAEDKLLKELTHAFRDIIANPNRNRAIFCADRVGSSLSYGYFEIIGAMLKHPEGVALLEKSRFFNSFYHLLELKKRDDLLQSLIESMDYSLDTHARILFSKALTSGDQETRLFATHHLGRILHDQPALQDWAIRLLVTQLYDTAMEVCDVAVMYLEEACSDPIALEKVVSYQPCLEHLEEIGYPLFMRFVSTSIGFAYLHRARYIDQELESWVTERNLLYVIEVETFVSRTARPFTSDTVDEPLQHTGMAPTHFFGELTKTPEGCRYLQSKGLVADFAEVLRLHGMESADQGVMTHVKSILWALGHLGSTAGGLQFLEEEEIIDVIVEIAEQSPVLTMKGTCFFVLGLISTSIIGAEILEEYGWIATRTSLGRPTGICLPNDIARFAFIEPWTRTEMAPVANPLPKLAGLEEEIMTSIGKLSNFVLAAKAMNNLKRIRTRHPRYFSSITLFHRALRIISSNHYQAPVRRFILDLFDIKLEPETLIQLRHIELSLRPPPPLSDRVKSPLSPTRARATYGNGDGEGDEGRNMLERRRRSASSPGPEPPGRITRMRGLTVSELP